jgi:hypothetical protein
MLDATLAVSKIEEMPRKLHLRRYVVGFVGVQIFVLLFVLFLASTPWFMTHDAYPGMQQAGYGMRLRQADCGIVVYGDSSALTGLDPDVIQAITGLKTCNISEGTTIQGVVGSRYPLDSYLQNNKRPLYMLMMYTPSIFRPYVEKLDNYEPEGMLYALQYRDHEVYRGLLRKRKWVVDFDFWAGRQMVKEFLKRYLPGGDSKPATDTKAQRESHHGNWPYPLPPETHCMALDENRTKTRPDAAGVAEMRKIYGIDGTTVVVNVAPVPTCDMLQQTYRERSEGLHDNAFETLPISFFNEGDVHFSPEGVRHISIEAGNQILALEQQRPPNHPLANMSAERPQ